MPLPKHLLISYVQGLELSVGNSDTPRGDDEHRTRTRNALSYIHRVKLTAWTSDIALLSRVADGPGDAFVGAGSAVSFVANLNPQLKRDVMNSTLFAQLQANSSHNRQEEPQGWFDAYIEALSWLGWDTQGRHLSIVLDPNSYDSVDNLDLTLAEVVMSPAEFKLYKLMVDGLDKSVNKAATKLFDRFSMGANKASFQTGLVSESRGDAVMMLSANSYSIEADIVTVLFTKFGKQSVTFLHNRQTVVLDVQFYSTIRNEIIERLGDDAAEFVKSIKL